MWVPNALLPEGLAVMKAWGFDYKSNIVWHKIRKDGGSDRARRRLLFPQCHGNPAVRHAWQECPHAGAGAAAGEYDRDAQARTLAQARRTICVIESCSRAPISNSSPEAPAPAGPIGAIRQARTMRRRGGKLMRTTHRQAGSRRSDTWRKYSIFRSEKKLQEQIVPTIDQSDLKAHKGTDLEGHVLSRSVAAVALQLSSTSMRLLLPQQRLLTRVTTTN